MKKVKKITNEDKLLNIEDIMEMFNVSQPTAYQIVKTKGFPGIKIKRIWRFDKQLVKNWIIAQSQTA